MWTLYFFNNFGTWIFQKRQPNRCNKTLIYFTSFVRVCCPNFWDLVKLKTTFESFIFALIPINLGLDFPFRLFEIIDLLFLHACWRALQWMIFSASTFPFQGLLLMPTRGLSSFFPPPLLISRRSCILGMCLLRRRPCTTSTNWRMRCP